MESKMTTATQSVADIIKEAFDAARKASQAAYDRFGGDGYACGFAWVEVYKVRRNSKLGKELISAGFRPSHKSGVLDVWNPGGMAVQNMDIKEALAQMDVLDDEQWTQEGSPKTEVVSELVGSKVRDRKSVV
jgi:hypothetical protein